MDWALLSLNQAANLPLGATPHHFKLMTTIPHPDSSARSIKCAIITVSDTRTPETDRSGQLIQQLLVSSGHLVTAYSILKDEPELISAELISLCEPPQGSRQHRPDVEALIFHGGTGIAPRDTTYDAIAGLLQKTLPGFGEVFRWLSYQEIGSRAIASRAIAGVYESKIIFSLPGSTKAVQLALEKLIIPELVHLVNQLNPTQT